MPLNRKRGYRSPKFALRRRKRLILISLVSLLGVLFLLALAWFTFHADGLQLTRVDITGAQDVSDTELRNVVAHELGGTYLLMIPRTFTFLYPRQDIESAVLLHDLRVRTVVAQRVGLQNLSVAITERMPVARWCGVHLASSTSPGNCYLVDNEGLIFVRDLGKGSSLVALFSPRASSTLSKFSSEIGMVVMTKESFGQAQQIWSTLEGLQLPVSRLHVVNDREWRFYVPDGWYISLDPLNDLEETLNDVIAALEAKKRDASEKITKLKYIDARFAGKVVFQFEE
jgi:hypothetical protein